MFKKQANSDAADPKWNPAAHLETDEEKAMGLQPVVSSKTLSGYNGPRELTFTDGSQAIGKSEVRARHLDPLAARLYQSLGISVPPTVVRRLHVPGVGTGIYIAFRKKFEALNLEKTVLVMKRLPIIQIFKKLSQAIGCLEIQIGMVITF